MTVRRFVQFLLSLDPAHRTREKSLIVANQQNLHNIKKKEMKRRKGGGRIFLRFRSKKTPNCL